MECFNKLGISTGGQTLISGTPNTLNQFQLTFVLLSSTTAIRHKRFLLADVLEKVKIEYFLTRLRRQW